MRSAVATAIVAVSAVAWAEAQELQSAASVEKVRVNLLNSQSSLLSPPGRPGLTPVQPLASGMQTFLTADTGGEMVKVAVPVGKLASRLAHAVVTCQHRRASRKAHEDVLWTVVELETQPVAR